MQKTSTQTICSNRGFSLIEVLIVLGILAALAAFTVPRLNFKQGNLKSSLRQLSVLSRETRQHARIKQATYRIVFDLESDPQKYWLEYTTDTLSGAISAEDEEEAGEDNLLPAFQKDESLLKKERQIPPGVRIESVTTQSLEEPQTDKLAYIYYWPNGLADAGVILLNTTADKKWSIVIQPLTGRAEIFEQEIRIQDILSR